MISANNCFCVEIGFKVNEKTTASLSTFKKQMIHEIILSVSFFIAHMVDMSLERRESYNTCGTANHNYIKVSDALH